MANPLNLRNMSPELVEVFTALWNDVANLNACWSYYKQLFNNAETVDVLNRSAALLFRVVQDSLSDSILQGLCRLTDPAKTGKHKNNSLAAMVEHLPQTSASNIKRTVTRRLRGLDYATGFARRHRDKRISHTDQQIRLTGGLRIATVERIDKALSQISQAMVDVELAYHNTPTNYAGTLIGHDVELITGLIKQFQNEREQKRNAAIARRQKR